VLIANSRSGVPGFGWLVAPCHASIYIHVTLLSHEDVSKSSRYPGRRRVLADRLFGGEASVTTAGSGRVSISGGNVAGGTSAAVAPGLESMVKGRVVREGVDL